MLVTNVNNNSQIQNKKKITKSSGSGFAAHLTETEEADNASAASPVFATNSLFMLQEVSEDDAQKQELVQQGFDALDYLDNIRLSLLDGSVSSDLLHKIESLTKSWRNNFNDPALADIIDEIELRAAVELAKLERG